MQHTNGRNEERKNKIRKKNSKISKKREWLAIANPKTCSKSIAHLTSPQKTATHTHTEIDYFSMQERQDDDEDRKRIGCVYWMDFDVWPAFLFCARCTSVFLDEIRVFFLYPNMFICVYICGMKIAKDRKLKKNCSNVFLYIIQAHIFSVVV